MPKNDIEISEQQRRRRRVNRIKNGIIITIATWMLLSFTAIIVLIVQVVKLNLKYQKVSVQLGLNQQDDDSENAELDKYENLVVGIDTEDNAYVDGDTRKVYLTFDCTPSENTNVILDALAESGVKATFFVTGDESDEAKAIYRRIVEEGHTLAMHSYSDDYSQLYSDTDVFAEDTTKLQNYLEDVTGVKSTFYRFPGGTFNEISDLNMADFVSVLNQNSITYFDWNVTAGDSARNYSVKDLVTNITDGVTNYKNSVVLLHDNVNKAKTAEAIESIVDALLLMDAQILPIDESTYKVQYIKAYSVN